MRTGASVRYVRASLVCAVRTYGTEQLAPGGARLYVRHTRTRPRRYHVPWHHRCCCVLRPPRVAKDRLFEYDPRPSPSPCSCRPRPYPGLTRVLTGTLTLALALTTHHSPEPEPEPRYDLRRADCLDGSFPPLPTNAATSLGPLRPPAPGATSCLDGVGAGAAPRTGSALVSASAAAAALAA
eukprot:scaffold82269_cov60-Phaeocystis_antarctica.AAC.3